MFKCDQEQSMKRIAELHQERRRPRRAIVEYSPKGSLQSNRALENAHYHLEGLLLPMRSDLIEKTGENVNAKSLLAHWLLPDTARGVGRGLQNWANGIQATLWPNGVFWRGHLLPNSASNPDQDGTKVRIRWCVLGKAGLV